MPLSLANYFQPSVPSESNDIPSDNKSTQASSRLERFKRQLLQKNDWAAVGATRPVRILFTPAEELARFGKRRKLTHADYDRILPVGGTVARPVSNETHQRAPSELETIGHMNIRIRGPQTNTGCQNQHRESSQTMLLDEEPIHGEKSQELCSYNRKRTDSSCLLLSNDDLANLSISSVLSPGSDHPRPRKAGSPELHHPVPQLPRRFTIDEPLSAEPEGSVAPSPFNMTIDHATCKRGAGMTSDLPPEPAHGPDEAVYRQSTSNWLPKPRHQIPRFMETSRDSTSPATNLSEVVDDEYLTRPLRQYDSPAKLFGQTVVTDAAHDTHQDNSSFQYEAPVASRVSTLQPHCFSLGNHPTAYNSPNKTGSTPTRGFLQDGPDPRRPQISGSSFASIQHPTIYRQAQHRTSQQSSVISSSGDFDGSFM